MPKFFIENNQLINNNQIEITGSDVNHIKNVLRKKIGDIITICNLEDGNNYISQIVEIQEEKIVCNIKERQTIQTEANIKVSIFQGLPKADKMESVIQKATELGVYDIFPLQLKRCVVKVEEKDKGKKKKRWQTIAQVAAKQCGRNKIPEIRDFLSIIELEKMINQYDAVLIAYEAEQDNSIKEEIEKLKQSGKHNLSIGVIIGPEGGLEEKEVKLLEAVGAKSITLGKRILRTETVALTILSILMYELGDLN